MLAMWGLLAGMVKTTSQNFGIAEVPPDKAYGSRQKMEVITAVGATPFIAFKSNNVSGTGMWGQMFHFFMFKRDEFLQHYHKRSNVESTFSMMKRKFGDSEQDRYGNDE